MKHDDKFICDHCGGIILSIQCIESIDRLSHYHVECFADLMGVKLPRPEKTSLEDFVIN